MIILLPSGGHNLREGGGPVGGGGFGGGALRCAQGNHTPVHRRKVSGGSSPFYTKLQS